MNDETQDGDAVLIPASRVARMLQVSTRTLWRLCAAGKVIGPVKIGRNVRWRRDELMRWIADGCPTQSQDKGGPQ